MKFSGESRGTLSCIVIVLLCLLPLCRGDHSNINVTYTGTETFPGRLVDNAVYPTQLVGGTVTLECGPEGSYSGRLTTDGQHAIQADLKDAHGVMVGQYYYERDQSTLAHPMTFDLHMMDAQACTKKWLTVDLSTACPQFTFDTRPGQEIYFSDGGCPLGGIQGYGDVRLDNGLYLRMTFDLGECTLSEPAKIIMDIDSILTNEPCTTNNGGMLGDPHIMRWNGKRLSFHGECDLVMIHNEEFGGGKGLKMHMRTTIDKFYSFVETMALRIGDDTLEISSEEIHFNDNKQAYLPASISGYPISVQEDGANKVIRMDLHNGNRIEVKIYKHFLSVNVAATGADFGSSVGLLGDFHTGAMLGRDGKTIIELDDEFGVEWQVQADEPKLFHSTRSPQLPEEVCRMPRISAGRGLRSGPVSRKKAEEACKDKDPEALDFCVFDVMATGDLGMAGAW